MATLEPDFLDPIGVGNTDQLGRTVGEPFGTDGVWADYQITNKYVRHLQTYMLPLASPNAFQGQSVAFVALAAPTTLLVVEWTGCRWNDVPTLPDQNLFDPNWQLLYVFPDTVMKIVGSDGVSLLYRVNGTYVYGKKNPTPSVFSEMTFPVPPWLDDQGTPRTISPGKFVPGLIDGNGGLPPIA